MLRELGLDAQTVFTHPDIRVWRRLPDRENATLDATLADGRAVRLHIKRYPAARRGSPTAGVEAMGIQKLNAAGIGTVPLVAWGNDAAGRSFIMTEDLVGRRPLDKLIAEGLSFDAIAMATAQVAATLHAAHLHHRDLYLCHFFARTDDPAGPLALIDAARVRGLPGLFAGRWIVKDLAQFWYSAEQLNVPHQSLVRWLEQYAALRNLNHSEGLVRAVERKAAWIGRHDKRLRRRQPGRNVSIPQTPQVP